MEKTRLTIFTILLATIAYLIDQDDIVLSVYLDQNKEHFDTRIINSKTFLTYGDLIDHLTDDCNDEGKSRLIIPRYLEYKNLRIETKGRVIIEPMNLCLHSFKINYTNALLISDNDKKDPRNINLLDSDKSIYNKLMFHYLNYGARPIYAERPSKAFLQIRMSPNGDIELFNQLMRKVAFQCEKLDKNFPNMIPCFAVMFNRTPTPPPALISPETKVLDY
jgi:hypothetical protein